MKKWVLGGMMAALLISAAAGAVHTTKTAVIWPPPNAIAFYK
ncbi:hypothetical protein [Tumebacillus flagellatus]|nr:hypothetical protein [Tumebacillus flagellatus]